VGRKNNPKEKKPLKLFKFRRGLFYLDIYVSKVFDTY